MKGPFFLLIFLLTTTAALADSVLDLQGTIGNLPVYFHLEEFSTSETPNTPRVEAHYFYQTSLKDIVLQGSKDGKQYNLFLNQDGKTFDERCILNTDGNGKFTGTWTNKKGKSLPVSLKKLDVSKINHPYKDNSYVRELRKNDAFNYARSSFIKLKRDSTTNYNGKSFVWFSETHCDANLFRLANGFATQSLKIINPALDSIHFLQIIEQMTCSSFENYSTGTNIYYTANISYLTGNLLGFSLFSAYDCGGAHPDFGGRGYLIDLRSGRQYDIDEILAFHPSATTLTENNSDQFYAYREKYFAPQLLKLETSIHHFEKPKNELDCDYLDEEVWKFPSWNFTEKGIEFVPSFPRVNRVCEEKFLVPFSVLKPYKNPSFLYSF